MQVALGPVELQDGIADQLARTVVGDVSSALDLDDGHGAVKDVLLRVEAASEGDDVRMLDEQEGVADLVGNALQK